MNYRYPILIICIFYFGFSLAQRWDDDFTDEEIVSNPAWSGDVDDFTVNENIQLQLNADDAGNSFIYGTYGTSSNIEWEIFVDLDFAPSGSNQLEILLLGASNNLEDQAYLLRVGESGSEDAIEVYKRSGGEELLLFRGEEGSMASGGSIRLRLVYDSGSWVLEADMTGGFDYTLMGAWNDSDLFGLSTAYFGISCSYTSTRVDKFAFDDIRVGAPVPDTEGPVVIASEITSATELLIRFNEAIDPLSFSSASINWLGTYMGNTTVNSGSTGHEIILDLSIPLESPKEYELSVTGFTDESGNEMREFLWKFRYFESADPKEFDIIFTEIMADPTPAIGLPEVEYVELYNRSNKFFQLDKFSLASGSSETTLASYELAPNQYVLIADAEHVGQFSGITNICAAENLFALSNEGDDVSLKYAGELIHEVVYNSSWYHNSSRDDGGYSLEMRNREHLCLGSENWAASESLSGGTPAMENQTQSLSEDRLNGLILEGVIDVNADSVFLYFDRKLSTNENYLNYLSIDGIAIDTAIVLESAKDIIVLVLNELLESGKIYTMKVSESTPDCVGLGSIGVQEVELAIPERPGKGDLIISEVLSNPVSGSIDFIEIYNNSNKVLGLDGLALRNEERDETVKIDARALLLPAKYYVIAETRMGLDSIYELPHPQQVLESEIPGFNISSGNVQLGYIDLFGLDIVDEMNYTEDMHYTFLDDTKGISLEKILLSESGLDANNWHSASEDSGWGTPTAPNSQAIDLSSEANSTFNIPVDRLSPNLDGIEDFLLIQYEFSQSGYKVRAEVFNDIGQHIRILARDMLLGTKGSLRWDGLDNDGNVPAMGIYIVFLEAVHPDGDVIMEKFPVVLAKQF